MFPTTVWDVVRAAGADDAASLDQIAAQYRTPVFEFIRMRGVAAAAADDLCQDVFVKLLKGGVLAKADPGKGAFRSLLRTITQRAIIDFWRRRKPPLGTLPDVAEPEPDFDKAWALHLTERVLEKLKEESPGYHAALAAHLDGRTTNRNRLWIARTRLSSLVRREVALTCRSRDEIADELKFLEPYLRPRKA